MPPICRRRLSGSGLCGARREKARSWRVSPAPALRRLVHAVHQPAPAGRVGVTVEHLQAPGDHHQQVVEVVGDAARELANRFDLLRLAEHFLDPRPLRHLRAEFFVSLGERQGARLDQALEVLGRLHLGRDQRPDLVLSGPGSHRRLDGAGQGDRLHWPLQKRDVAELRHQLVAPSRNGRLFSAAGQHHEGKVGPCGLGRNPTGQTMQVMAEQAFLGDQHRGSPFGDLAFEFVEVCTDLRRQVDPIDELGGGAPVSAYRREDQDP